MRENKKYKCATSHFALLEVLEVIKDNKFIINKLGDGYTLKWILRKRHEKDLSKIELRNIYNKMYDNFFKKYKFVDFYWLERKGWEKAIDISAQSNISSTDIIHLATAIELECDVLVTSDEYFCEQANEFIPSCLPENFNKKLEELF